MAKAARWLARLVSTSAHNCIFIHVAALPITDKRTRGWQRGAVEEGTAGARAREEYAESVSRVQAAKIEARCDVEDDGQVQGQVDLARGHRVAAHNGIHLEHGSVTAVRVVEALAYRRLPCWPCG